MVNCFLSVGFLAAGRNQRNDPDCVIRFKKSQRLQGFV
jgi:hypothetical protein